MAFDTSSATDSIILPNNSEPHRPLLTVNLTNITKLTNSNYITWNLQLRSLLEGYGLQIFVDRDYVPPPATITADASDIPNPAYQTWVRQDRLLFSALLGSLSPPLQPLVAHTTTTLELWQTLATTFATPSRGHLKQLKDQLQRCTKGNRPISTYLQEFRTHADALALLGKPVDDEDLIDSVLAGLGDEYRSVIDAINARESVISFPELHDKLLNWEPLLLADPSSPLPLPATAHPATAPQRPPWRGHLPRGHQQATRALRPYLGRCQACGTQGHSVKRCP